MEAFVAEAMRLEEEGTVVPPLMWEAIQSRTVRDGVQPARRARWPWVVAAGLVVATAVPVAADVPLQQAVLGALGGRQQDPGLYAAATGGNWQAVHLVSAAGGFALDCSGYYYDGYETAILCSFTLPAAVARAHADYGPFEPILQLTDGTGRTLGVAMAEGGPGKAMLYIFHGALQPGQVTLRVTGLPTAPAGVPAADQPQFPPVRFNLRPTTDTPAVVVRDAGAVTLHGIRVSVSELVSSPGMTHVTVHWDVTRPDSGMTLTGQPLAGGVPSLLLRPEGPLPPALALRTVIGGTLPFHGGGSGPAGASGDFDAAPGVRSFTVVVPAVTVALAGGGTRVIQGPWVVPVHIPH
jgi:hypothetical protein